MKYSFVLLLGILNFNFGEFRYQPTWESLDSRPLPAWYDEGKVGVMLHWGVFSVPSFGSEWFWQLWKSGRKDVVEFMRNNYKPGFSYPEFAPQFTAEFYDPDRWADIFQESGARYVVLTSKHHEGFTNWRSNVSWNWNSVDVGPKKDLIAALANSVRKRTDLKFGLYHSMFEWYNPLYLADAKNNYKTQNFVKTKTMPELYEIVNAYKPELIWSDGEWMTTYQYWNSREFLAWLYNDSPVKDSVIVNDRWGNTTRCKHGGYFTCDDRYNPGVLQKHKFENAMTIDKVSWGYRRNAPLSDYLTNHELIKTLAETVSCGGNLLMNIGPTKDGLIVPVFEERLKQFGQWMKINGDAIYKSRPWKYQNDTVTKNIWYTSQPPSEVFAIVLDWPSTGSVILGAATPTNNTRVTMLGYEAAPFKYTARKETGMIIDISTVRAEKLPSKDAWVFKLENLH